MIRATIIQVIFSIVGVGLSVLCLVVPQIRSDSNAACLLHAGSLTVCYDYSTYGRYDQTNVCSLGTGEMYSAGACLVLAAGLQIIMGLVAFSTYLYSGDGTKGRRCMLTGHFAGAGFALLATVWTYRIFRDKPCAGQDGLLDILGATSHLDIGFYTTIALVIWFSGAAALGIINRAFRSVGDTHSPA